MTHRLIKIACYHVYRRRMMDCVEKEIEANFVRKYVGNCIEIEVRLGTRGS